MVYRKKKGNHKKVKKRNKKTRSLGNRLEKLLLACLPDHLAPSPTAAAPAIAGKAPLSSLLHLLPEMCLFPAPFFSLYLAIPYSSPRSQLTLQGLQEAFTCLTQVCAPSPCPKALSPSVSGYQDAQHGAPSNLQAGSFYLSCSLL